MGNVSSTSTHESFAIDGPKTNIQMNPSERAELASVKAANVGHWLGQLDDRSDPNGKRPKTDITKATQPKKARWNNVRRGDFAFHNEVEIADSEDERLEARPSRQKVPSPAVSNASTRSNIVVLQRKQTKLVVLKISADILKELAGRQDGHGDARSSIPSLIESAYDDDTDVDSVIEAAATLVGLSKAPREYSDSDGLTDLARGRLPECAPGHGTVMLGTVSNCSTITAPLEEEYDDTTDVDSVIGRPLFLPVNRPEETSNSAGSKMLSRDAKSRLKRHASGEFLLALGTPSTSSTDLDCAMDLDDATDVSSHPSRPTGRVVPIFRFVPPPLNKSPLRPATEQDQDHDLARAIASQPDLMGRTFPESSLRTPIIGNTIFDKGGVEPLSAPTQPSRVIKKPKARTSHKATTQHAAPQPLAMNLHRTRGMLRNLDAVTISVPSAENNFKFTTNSSSSCTAAELDALLQPPAHPKPEPYCGPHLSYAAFGNMPRKGHATRLVRGMEKAQEEENEEVRQFVSFVRKAKAKDVNQPVDQVEDDSEESHLHYECSAASCRLSMVWCPKEGRCMDELAELTHDGCSEEVCELMSEWCPKAEWVVEAREMKEATLEENEKGNVMEWED
ncbi:hypothetical protein FB567DRAFT_547588 [Paraphoma chrysanthemicola]|uniref:Uncharacterized protein n=1 Tax=Paraphoma chrysanthemicola TaxID=798071 RepID=A0A8K0R7M3_9PLEO|nr:hypothetical protein FB567DRAFT_547588 [Paraphoma chrysanthemicola]